MDLFKEYNNEYVGFFVIGVFTLMMTLLNTYFLGKIKEPSAHREIITVKVKDTFTIPFKDAKYRKVIILFILWNMGVQMAGPFVAIYMVNGLKLDYTYIMVLSVLTPIVRVFVTKYWGKIADTKSWFFSTKVSIAILAFSHAAWFFVDSRTVWILAPIINIVGGIAWAGINISIFNIQFVMAPKECRTVYLGASSAFGGFAGFISTLISSMIVKKFKGFSIDVLGCHIGNMQIVFALSGIILLITAFYVHFFISQKEVYTEQVGV